VLPKKGSRIQNNSLKLPNTQNKNNTLHIPTNIGKVAFTFSKLEENDSNGSQQAIGEVFVLVAGLNFAQFAK
jgi:hypothetical protein